MTLIIGLILAIVAGIAFVIGLLFDEIVLYILFCFTAPFALIFLALGILF